MRILVTYDVSTVDPEGTRRLRRVARACLDYGQRVQKSVFECVVGGTDWAVFRARLLDEIDADKDSLRFYHLSSDTRIEHHGVKEPIDLEGPLVL